MSPIYENPQAEHARLEREIRTQLKELAWDEGVFNVYVQRRYETSSKWHEQSIRTKEELKAFLTEKIKERAAA